MLLFSMFVPSGESIEVRVVDEGVVAIAPGETLQIVVFQTESNARKYKQGNHSKTEVQG